MSDAQISISGPVGYGVANNNYTDNATIQFLLNAARARIGMKPIGVDGDVGPETIGAITDFQKKAFGGADGRVDVGGRSFRKLVEIHSEPELVKPTTYKRGKGDRYKVTVGEDGRIFVQSKDWLSKYSAAIYGDFHHVYDFGRMENGKIHLLRDVNLIRAGEVLYHIPTWQKFMGDKTTPKLPTPPTLSDQEKSRIMQEFVKGEYDLKGDYGVKLVDYVGKGLGYAAPIAEGLSFFLPVLAGAATVLGLVVIPIQMYEYMRDFCNAHDVDLRIYGLRGAAYAATAWAFGDSIPTHSPELRQNQRQQFGGDTARLQKYDKAWKDAAEAMIRTQERYAVENLGNTLSRDEKIKFWKLTLQGTGEGKRTDVNKLQMKALGERFLKDASRAAKRSWDYGIDNTLYPN